jgi:hypothetical protein
MEDEAMTGLKAGSAVLVVVGIVVAMTEIAVAAPPGRRGGARSAPAEEAAPSVPAAVSQALQARFPQGKITDAESEVTDGVTVYAVEFTDGSAEKMATISASGIVMDVGTPVSSGSVPKVVMDAIKKAAAGAKIGQIHRIDITHDAENGAVTKLPTPEVEYSAELTKGGKSGEVTVGSDGTVDEPVSWE